MQHEVSILKAGKFLNKDMQISVFKGEASHNMKDRYGLVYMKDQAERVREMNKRQLNYQ